MPTISDRRRDPRHSAYGNDASVEWWDGRATRSVPARVVNISGSGALIRAEEPPPVDQPVWVRIDSPARTPWVGARVVRIGEDRSAGLAFLGACPHDFYQAATLGIGYGNLIDRPATDDEGAGPLASIAG